MVRLWLRGEKGKMVHPNGRPSPISFTSGSIEVNVAAGLEAEVVASCLEVLGVCKGRTDFFAKLFAKLVNVKHKAAFGFSFMRVDMCERNFRKLGDNVANAGGVEKWKGNVDAFVFHVKHDLREIKEGDPIRI